MKKGDFSSKTTTRENQSLCLLEKEMSNKER